MEIWKDVKGLEGFYQVSNIGNVRSVKRYVNHYLGGKSLKKSVVLKKRINAWGYYSVILKKNSKTKNCVCHKLVAESFIINENNKPIINHKNGIKTDNRVENLEWCTYSENTKHAFDNNLIYIPKKEERYNSKITEEIVKEIRENKLNLKNVDYAKKYSVSKVLITNIKKNKTWKINQI